MALGVPANVLGLIVSGDVSGLTIYTDRYGRKVVFPKAPPKEPPTPAQVTIRLRFKQAQQEYMRTSADEKRRWEKISLATSLCMTGQNLFIHVAMRLAYGTLDTLMRQSGINVTPPTPRP